MTPEQRDKLYDQSKQLRLLAGRLLDQCETDYESASRTKKEYQDLYKKTTEFFDSVKLRKE